MEEEESGFPAFEYDEEEEEEEDGEMLMSPQTEEQESSCSGEVAAFAGCLHSLGLGAVCEEAYSTVLFSELEVSKTGRQVQERAHVQRLFTSLPLCLFPSLVPPGKDCSRGS